MFPIDTGDNLMRSKDQELMRRIIDFINDYHLENYTTPTMQEIADKFHLAKSSASRYVAEMRENGMLEHTKGKSGIKTHSMNKYDNTNLVPVVGAVACGKPLLAEENVETYLPLPTSILGKGKFFILKAHGDSMINAGIKNVDHVIVGIGDDVEGCIMTVMALKNIGIENITVKSGNDKLTTVLKSLGINDIVRPEKEVGMMVAKRNMHRLVSDFVSMDNKHSLVQIKIEKEKLFNKPLMELGFRNNFNLNIVAIKSKGEFVIPNATTVLHKEDVLYLIGEDTSIYEFEKYLEKE